MIKASKAIKVMQVRSTTVTRFPHNRYDHTNSGSTSHKRKELKNELDRRTGW